MKLSESIFKAYDVRGLYPFEINEGTVFEISKKISRHWRRKSKIVIGRDARLSSPALHAALIAGLSQDGNAIKIIDAGEITTPMLYFLVNKLRADGGIMLTASHNPKEYNGLKVVGKNAEPISGKEILRILNKKS